MEDKKVHVEVHDHHLDNVGAGVGPVRVGKMEVSSIVGPVRTGSMGTPHSDITKHLHDHHKK